MSLFDSRYLNTGFNGYPICTIICYGSDDVVVKKIVASIIPEEEADVSVMKKWVGEGVMHKRVVREEIKKFIEQNSPKSIVISETPVGCIHEEGEDYPLGEDCPFCPFWKGKQGSTDQRV